MPAAKGHRRPEKAATRSRSLLEKIRSLPENQRAAVEKFLDLLQSSGNDLALSGAATRLSDAAFRRVWDNPTDAAYDQL